MQQDKGSGRILLDENTGGRVVILWPVRFQCVGFLLNSVVYICVVD